MEPPAEQLPLQTRIVRHILRNCPYGETRDMIKDVQKIAAIDVNDKETEGNLKFHNDLHLAPARTADGNTSILLTPSNQDAEGNYFDPGKKIKAKINHLAQTIESTQPYNSNLPPNVEKYRTIFDTLIDKYMQSCFRDKDTFYVVVGEGSDSDFKITVHFTSKNLNFKNYYGGEWIASWEITPKSYKGNVRINGHFFEEGNVQLTLDKKFEEKFDLTGDAENEAKHIVQEIIKFDDSLLKALKDMYENMTDQYFKAMRNILPVTKDKIKWENSAFAAAAHYKKK